MWHLCLQRNPRSLQPQKHTHTCLCKWVRWEKNSHVSVPCKSCSVLFANGESQRACDCSLMDHISLGDRENTSQTVKETLSVHICQGRQTKKKAEGSVFESLFLILTRKNKFAHFLHPSLHKIFHCHPMRGSLPMPKYSSLDNRSLCCW